MKHRCLMALFLLALTFAAQADLTEAVVAHAQGNFERALEVLLPLAQSSKDPYAQYYLGIMYANGQGVAKDLSAAGRWFKSAAELGIPQAQFRLGELYAQGQGVTQDFGSAYAWFSVASQSGHSQAAAALTDTSGKLSPEKLEAGGG
ncbi:MAG: tetratricopeptide repeat protein, partial [Gammaproteobacteria bacterium]